MKNNEVSGIRRGEPQGLCPGCLAKKELNCQKMEG